MATSLFYNIHRRAIYYRRSRFFSLAMHMFGRCVQRLSGKCGSPCILYTGFYFVGFFLSGLGAAAGIRC